MSVLTKMFSTTIPLTTTFNPAELATLVATATRTRSDRYQLHADVVVVGAGLSGLMAARTLVAANLRTLVIEARDRVGGRVHTETTADGISLDLGGHWLGPSQRRLATLARDMGIPTFPTYTTGQHVEYRDEVRHLGAGALPSADALLSADAINALLALNALAAQIPPDTPWTAPSAAEWDTQTLATWLAANVPSASARALLARCACGIFAAEPHEISLLHVLHTARTAGGMIDLFAVSGGARELRFRGGAQRIANCLAEALGPRLLLSSPVHTVAYEGNMLVRVEGDAGSITARRAILALPPALAGRLRYQPALPGRRDQLTQRMPMGATYTAHCLYPTPFWRELGLSGQIWSDTGPIHHTLDDSPESGSPGILLGFIQGDNARHWSRLTAGERKVRALECLVRSFGERAASPTEYVETAWADEEYTRGGPAGYMPTGLWTTLGDALRAPIGPIHWAGAETATEWAGYMEGALQSGERAAREVIAALAVE